MTNYVTASYSVQMPEIKEVIKSYTANKYDHNYIVKNRFELIDQLKFFKVFVENITNENILLNPTTTAANTGVSLQ
jgi:hypothetical protein